MPNNEMPFSGKTNRFITYYSFYEDLPRAAIEAGLTFTKAKELYRQQNVREEIDRRIDKIHDEQAKLIARAELLTERALDAHLMRAIETETGMVLVKAVELGYKKHGLLSDKVEHSGAGGGPMVFSYERIEGKKESA